MRDRRWRPRWRQKIQRLAVAAFGTSGITLARQQSRFLDQLLRRGRREFCKERPHLRFRHSTGELGNHLPIAERFHGGNALDAEVGRSHGVFIGVQFGKQHRPRGFGSDPFDDWPKNPARSTPWRPEVDHHRTVPGFFDYRGGKRGIGNIERGGRRGHLGLLAAKERS